MEEATMGVAIGGPCTGCWALSMSASLDALESEVSAPHLEQRPFIAAIRNGRIHGAARRFP
jgi:hypothetical protein